jgi:hypothetical protein
MLTSRSQTEPKTIQQRLGVVAYVDQEKGILVLVCGDGTCSQFNAHASLLGDLRIGGPVLALVEGTNVWSLRRL